MSKRTSIVYSEEDQAAIEEIREKFGLSSDVEAVRLGLRLAREVSISDNIEIDTEEYVARS